MSDQYDGLGLPRRFVATHARRIRRHSRHGDADGIRSLFKQSKQRTDRDVTLYDVAIDQSGVTRGCVDGNTRLCFECGEVLFFP